MCFWSTIRVCSFAAFLTLVVLGPSGCSGGSGQAGQIEVKGKVFLGDHALKATGLGQAIVQFHQLDDAGVLAHKSFQGNFDEDGNYSVKVPPGDYKVVVIATKKMPEKTASGQANYAPPESVIPHRYNSPGTTTVKIDVANSAPIGARDIHLTKGES